MDPTTETKLVVLAAQIMSGTLKDPKAIALALADISVSLLPVADLKAYLDSTATAVVDTAVDLAEAAKVGP